MYLFSVYMIVCCFLVIFGVRPRVLRSNCDDLFPFFLLPVAHPHVSTRLPQPRFLGNGGGERKGWAGAVNIEVGRQQLMKGRTVVRDVVR